jgi:hypothetical protein
VTPARDGPPTVLGLAARLTLHGDRGLVDGAHAVSVTLVTEHIGVRVGCRFQPTLFERYQKSEKALVLALVEMYIHGVSTRKMQKIVEQLCGVLVSASQVSVLVRALDP